MVNSPMSANNTPGASPLSLFDANVNSILAQTSTWIERGRRLYKRIISRVRLQDATFANVVLPLVEEENQRLSARQLIEFYANIWPSHQQTSRDASTMFSDFDAEMYCCPELFALVRSVYLREESLEPESHHLVKTMMLDFMQTGLDLSLEGQTRLRQLNHELSQLEGEYLRTIEKTRQFILWLSPAELEGVPSAVLSLLEHGTDAQQGKFGLGAESHYMSIMSRVRRADTRRRVYLHRAHSSQTNVASLEQLFALRSEKAHLLGFPSHMDLLMSTRMESSPLRVKAFLDDLLLKLSPARDVLVSKWRQQKSHDLKMRGEQDDGKFYIWDRHFYYKILVEREIDIDSATIASFFPSELVMQKLLDLFEHVFSLSFRVVNTESDADNHQPEHQHSRFVWHDDVRIYAVWDTAGSDRCQNDGSDTDEFMGYLYLDLYMRPGKRQRFADLPIRPGYMHALKREYPATALVCSFDRLSGQEYCLLSHSQVMLLTHELGHGIHDLVAKTRYARFHGASTSADFNEAPSQMLEKWCWLPAILEQLNQHWSTLSQENMDRWLKRVEETSKNDTAVTPEGRQEQAFPPNKLSPGMIDCLIRSQKLDALNRTLALLAMALFDLIANCAHLDDTNSQGDTTRLYHAVMERVYGFDHPGAALPFQASELSHIQVDGMYIYLTSQIYASDLFQASFAADPMNAEQGLRYRRSVLEKGSSMNEADMLQEYLGRAPSADAFLAELGCESEQ